MNRPLMLGLCLMLISKTLPAGATGDLGIVVERASGTIQVIETTHNRSLGRVEGLGDLSHASAVYSRDGRTRTYSVAMAV